MMSVQSKLERLEKLLAGIAPPPPIGSDEERALAEERERFEEAKVEAIYAMLLSAMELDGVADPDDVAGIKLALEQWCTSSIVDLDRAIELVQELLSLPAEEQDAIRRGRVEPETDGVLDDGNGAAECEHDPSDCTCSVHAAARLAGGNGEKVEPPPPPKLSPPPSAKVPPNPPESWGTPWGGAGPSAF